EIENTGECRDIVDVEIIDELAGCLEYDNDASVDFAGEDEDRGPDRAWKTGGGTLLMWDLGEFGPLSPGDVIAIEYDAIAEEPGPNLNKATASGHCSHDYNNLVVSADLALVMVYGEEILPPSPEEVLSINLEVEAESLGSQSECHSFVTIHIEAEDLTGGSYPVESVSLQVNGLPWFSSGPLSTTHYSKTLPMEADCGQSFDFLAIAVNSEGVHATTAVTVTTPELS
ncbi:MAG: isopeptide-forming domain-containing fimbrial protein, partial [Dehalococcoidia bacterium]|nr:isopeptide-forming domain-containing fimbrial protein [Dehalococcoidia bacterium]